MSTPFYLSAEEIALIQALRQLSEHERQILTFCIQKSAASPPDEDLTPIHLLRSAIP